MRAAGCVIVHSERQRIAFAGGVVQFDTTPGAAADAVRYRRMFTTAVGDAGTVCVHDEAATLTPQWVIDHLEALLSDLSGGVLFLAVITHGDEVPDLTGEGESHDQSVILHHGSLADDRFGRLWAAHPTVDVVSFADLCHADTAILYAQRPQELPRMMRFRGVETRVRYLVDVSPTFTRRHTAPGPVVREIVRCPAPAPRRLAFAACQKWETAQADGDGGRFTDALMRAWSDGPSSYSEWYRHTASMTVGQTPTLRYVGPDESLLVGRPMKVGTPRD